MTAFESEPGWSRGDGATAPEKLDRAISLMTDADFLAEQVRKVTELRERFAENELIVSVVGQFKRGKSSLINAILGEGLLPVGIVPLTATVTEIRRSDGFRACVDFTNGEVREIGFADLSDYISEQKNKDNHKKVGIVKLWTVHSPFGTNVTLVDTPGVGSIHQHNTQASNAYIEKSDAVLFLLSFESPVSEVERDFLLHTRAHAAKFYFAVNKADAVDQQSRDEFIAYSSAVLSEITGSSVTLHPVSAASGEGIAALTRLIAADISNSHDELLADSISLKLKGILNQANSKIGLYLKAASIPAEELKEKLAALREKQLALAALAEEVQILTRRKTNRLIEQIREVLDGLIAGFLPELEALAGRQYEEWKALPSRQFEQKLLTTLEKQLDAWLINLNEKGLTLLAEGYASIVASLNRKAGETASFVSETVRDFFGVEYPVEFREFTVSERSDFYIRFKHDGSLFLDQSRLVHLLPRGKANAKVFASALTRLKEDLQRNKTNMLYNYGYKMQESLRLLYHQFAADISALSAELNALLEHAEKSRQSEDKSLQQTSEELTGLMKNLQNLAN